VTDVADVRVRDDVDIVRPRGDQAEPAIEIADAPSVSYPYRADAIALSILTLFTGIALGLRFIYDNWLSEPDIFTFFVPWFGYIGDRLRDFELPVWSTNYLSGTPVIGSPSSGWMYLPVMLIFPLLSVVTAFKTLILLQAAIAGAATYALSRRIGFGPMAALMSTAAFVLGPLLYASTRYIMVGSQVTTWIPVGLLAAEMALRARRLPALLGWAALGAIAISQMAVAWPGQGVMYGLMWIFGWILYRTAVAPADRASDLRDRLVTAVFAGTVMLLLGLAFAAAGILPLLDYSEQSTIPGGNYANVLGGDYATPRHSLPMLLFYLFSDNFSIRAEGYGGALILIAALGAIFAWGRAGVPFFATVFVVGLSLSVRNSPTVELFNLIPGFEHFHGHRPIAILWVLSLAPAMLAGAAVQQLLNARRAMPLVPMVATFLAALLAAAAVSSLWSFVGWWPVLTMILAIFLFALPSLELPGVVARWQAAPRRIATAVVVAGVVFLFGIASALTGWPGWWLLGTGAAFAAAYWLPTLELPPWARTWRPTLAQVAATGLIGIVILFPTIVDVRRTVRDPETPPSGWTQHLGRDDPTQWVINTVLARTGPGTAAGFLQTQRDLRAPFRYTGYSGQGYPNDDYTWVYNTFWWRRMEPGVVGILMNARALRLDLEQTSGYNPVQFRHYAEYIDAMNHARQDYHWADTYARALYGSQLLNMLNTRYIVVDTRIPADRIDHQQIARTYEEVYRDELAVVYENPRAFPRAWIVHDVRPNNDGEGLAQLANGDVDGRFVAFVDGPVPPVTVPPEQNRQASVPGEQVVITGSTPESLTVRATAVTDGLLVVSASYADGWNAYVDGELAEVLRTNHALRGVPLPTGEHEVILKYEPPELTTGLRITGVASVAMLGIWGWALVDFRRQAPGAPRSPRRPGGTFSNPIRRRSRS